MSDSVIAPSLAPLGAGEIASLAFENAGAAVLKGGVTTLGQSFLQGDLPRGASVVARVGDALVPVQMDVKTTYADGSVKMAVLSVERPDLEAGAKVDVVLAKAATPAMQPAVNLAQVAAGHSVTVDLAVEGKSPIRIDVINVLQNSLANGTASVWQEGPLATQARVEVLLEGTQRLLFDVTAFKGGGLEVNASFNNDRAMELTGGRVSYGVVAKVDGAEVLRETVNQGLYQNWRAEFSSNGHDGGQGLGSRDAGWLNIQHDVARLGKIGAVADFDTTLKVPGSALDAMTTQMASSTWGDPLAINGITQYMGAGGGRPDIGIVTGANSTWLLTQDARAAAFALGQAETAGAVPWNFYDARNGEWLNPTDYPKLWMDPRGGTGTPGVRTSTGPTQLADSLSGWAPDQAHQPELSFVPYLLTGERWILDNLQAQASFNLVGVWPYLRTENGYVVVNNGQVRESAWGLRQLDNALWATPDGSPQKAWLQAASDANWKFLVSKIPEWTAQQGEAHGWLPGIYGYAGAMAPWQQDFFASTVINAAARGNADAMTYLEWSKNYLVGRFFAADKGFAMHDGATYLIGYADPTTGVPYKTWAEIGAQTVARGYSNGEGWVHSQGYYGKLAMATLAGIFHLTGDPQAAKAYYALAADNPPFTTSDAYGLETQFAVTIPGIYGGTVATPISDKVVGTAGDDTVTLSTSSATLSVDLGAGNDTIRLADAANTGTISGVETILGGSGADTITLGAPMLGGMVDLGAGLDRLVLAAGNNMLDVRGVEAVVGGNAIDHVRLGDGGSIVTVSGVETLVGGVGADTVTLTGSANGIEVNLGGGADRLVLSTTGATRISVAGAETILGSGDADDITMKTPVDGALFDLRVGLDKLTLSSAGPNSLSVLNVETVIGGAVADTVTLGAPIRSATVDLASGSDRLILANGSNDLSVANVENVVGGTGADAIVYLVPASGALIDLGEGADRLTLSSAGANTLTARNVETITGGVSNDTVTLGAAMSGGMANLGGGIDRLVLSSGGANTLTISNVETVTGGSMADVVTLHTPVTGAGINLGGGLDRLLLSSAGANTLAVANVETITGGEAADTVTLHAPVTGAGINLGVGLDRLVLSSAGANTLAVANVETIIGGGAADTITLHAPVIGATINLAGGLDRLVLSSAGANTFTSRNVETITGGEAVDTVTLHAPVTGAIINLGGGLDRLVLSSAGANTLTVADVETVTGGGAADTVTLDAPMTGAIINLGGGLDRLVLSSAGANTLTVANVETVMGGNAADRITVAGTVGAAVDGGPGSDQLVCGAGPDTLIGSAGADMMTGGSGADRFLFRAAADSLVAAPDRVTDFQTGVDQLVFQDLLKGSFAYVGTGFFTGIGRSEARFLVAASSVHVDVNGDGTTDMAINLTGGSLTGLSAKDFVWT